MGPRYLVQRSLDSGLSRTTSTLCLFVKLAKLGRNRLSNAVLSIAVRSQSRSKRPASGVARDRHTSHGAPLMTLLTFALVTLLTGTLILAAFLVYVCTPSFAHGLLLHFAGFPEADRESRSTDSVQTKTCFTGHRHRLDRMIKLQLPCEGSFHVVHERVEPTTHGTRSTRDHLCLSYTASHMPNIVLNPHRPYF